MAVDCPWCGEKSVKDDVCEWCGRLIASKDPAIPTSDDDQEPDISVYFLAPLAVRMELFLATCLTSLAVVVALAGFRALPPVMAVAIASFAACFWLSTYQMVLSVDDAWAPAGLAIVLGVALGVTFATTSFLIVWLVTRRSESGSILLLLLVHMFSALLVSVAARPEIVTALRYAGWIPGVSGSNLTLMAGMAGWTLANFWRPLNEETHK